MADGSNTEVQSHSAPVDCVMQVGAMCWRKHRGRIEVLLITSRDTGRWVIPKGWTMDGLSPCAAAAREAWEEAGVEGVVSETRLGQFRYDKTMQASPPIRCIVQVFGLRVARLARHFPERKERRRKWFAADAAARKVNEPELRHLLMSLQDQLTAAGR